MTMIDMDEEIKKQIASIRGLLADSFQKYFGFEYGDATQMAVLSVVNKPLELDLKFPDQWLPALQKVRDGFERRDYGAMVEIGYAAHVDWLVSKNETPSIKDVCGFAYAVGVASGAVGQALHFRLKRKFGGLARSVKITEVEHLVMTKVKVIDGWEAKSADSLASEIIGISGISFSHRKIADTIRNYRKRQAA